MRLLIISVCLLNFYAECKWRPDYSVQKYNKYEHNKEIDYRSKRDSNWSRTNHWDRNEKANEISTRQPEMVIPDPPDHTKLIEMARYVLHYTDWASVATISTLPAIQGFPFSNVKSIVDGPLPNSTGVPYFYMSPLDFTARDLKKNGRATVLVSLEELKYCDSKNYDPEDPRCTRLILTGIMKKLKESSREYAFAKNALFERHPDMANFPPDHNWFIAKLKIAQIAMVDWFGGAKYIPVREYLNYNFTKQRLVKEETSAV